MWSVADIARWPLSFRLFKFDKWPHVVVVLILQGHRERNKRLSEMTHTRDSPNRSRIDSVRDCVRDELQISLLEKASVPSNFSTIYSTLSFLFHFSFSLSPSPSVVDQDHYCHATRVLRWIRRHTSARKQASPITFLQGNPPCEFDRRYLAEVKVKFVSRCTYLISLSLRYLVRSRFYLGFFFFGARCHLSATV